MARTCHYLVLLPLVLALSGMNLVPAAENPWVVYDGYGGPGKGKHIVLISGDDEYRSEEALPQLGKILARHHGFKCTVLFAIDRTDGISIHPGELTNIPGLENLKSARSSPDTTDSSAPSCSLSTRTKALSIREKPATSPASRA